MKNNEKLIVGVILTGLAILLVNETKGNNPIPVITPDVLPPNKEEWQDNGKDLFLTNHDAVWEYQRKAKEWWTRKKGSVTWVNMKKGLNT